MIGGGFLTAEERQDLTELARDGLAEHRLARRANALVLLDRGMSCVGRVLLIDDDTIRTWPRLFEADGVDGLAGFKYGGGACQLTLEQQVTLKTWVGDTLPRPTRSVDRTRVRGCLREPFRADCAGASSGTGTPQARGDVAQARPGQTAGLHRRLRDTAEDAARRRGGDVRRRGASHPWGAAGGLLGAQRGHGRGRPGRDRLNIHGALDLETGRTRMIEVVTVKARSTIALLVAIKTLYPAMRIIHVFLDNARYHH